MKRLLKNFVLLFSISFSYLNAESTPTIQKAYFEPFVVRDNIDYTKLVICCSDSNIQEIKIDLSSFLVSEQNPIILRDDGTNGDEIANDHYFTKNHLLFNLGVTNYTYLSFSNSEITYLYKDGTSEKSNLNFGLNLIIIDPKVFPIPNIKRSYIDSTIDNTDYVIAIKTNSNTDQEIIKIFYKYFEDNEDFFSIAFPFEIGVNISGSFSITSNTLSGIGLNIINHNSWYGSKNKLQGIIYAYPAGSPGLFNHEILHRYAVYLDPSLNLENSFHWNALVANTSGFGGGSIISGGVYRQIEHISGNNYRALTLDPSAVKYNDLELYLMGLKDQTVFVNPFVSLINPVSSGFISENGNFYELFTASGISEKTIEDIIKVQGNRNPPPLSSQKRFKIAQIVVCTRSLTDVEFAFYNHIMEEYEKSRSDIGLTFNEATSGLAEMRSRIISIDGSPQLSDPVQVSKPLANSMAFSWYRLDSALSYHFQLANSTDFDEILIDSLVNDTSILITLKNAQNMCFWRVKALNNFGESYWSETRPLSITSIEPLLLDYNVTIYPNPIKDFLSIRFNNSTYSYITINIVDLFGRYVYKENYKHVDPYEEKVLNLSLLKKGVYILKIKGKETNCVYKIIKE